jgi:hypothetical protein
MMRIPHRHPQWESRLIKAVEAWRDRPYRFAPGSDCVAFVLAVVEAVSGERLIIETGKYRTAAGQMRALRQLGWASLPEAADALLGDRIAPLQAMVGDVVSDGSALGVMTRQGPVAFGEDGLTVINRRSVVAAWPVGRVDG